MAFAQSSYSTLLCYSETIKEAAIGTDKDVKTGISITR